MKLKLVFLSAILFFSLQIYAQREDSITIVFDDSAIECMFLHPLDILNNVDSFWTNNPAYRLTKQWHTINNVEIPYNSWKRAIRKISKLSVEEAKNNIAYINASKIIAKENVFQQQAIPLIYSFLPSNISPINTKIYLLTKTVPYAFTINENIVIDVASPNFDRNPEKILNILVHEVYHVGFYNTIICRTEFEYENKILDYITDYLLSEGIANYVSYKVQNIFPNSGFEDYKMLENSNQVKKQIDNVNLLFSKINTTSYEDLIKLSWEIGVLKRAYYVAGSFMAQTIDQKMGRDSLVNAIATGPRKFINIYNSLVTNDMKIMEFELPNTISSYQYMRLALVNKDYQQFDKIKEELIRDKDNLDASLEGKINEYAYAFININRTNALKLFELNTILFPNSSNVWDSFGEFEMKQGNIETAIAYYQKAVLLQPSNTNAINKLKELQGN